MKISDKELEALVDKVIEKYFERMLKHIIKEREETTFPIRFVIPRVTDFHCDILS